MKWYPQFLFLGFTQVTTSQKCLWYLRQMQNILHHFPWRVLVFLKELAPLGFHCMIVMGNCFSHLHSLVIGPYHPKIAFGRILSSLLQLSWNFSYVSFTLEEVIDCCCSLGFLYWSVDWLCSQKALDIFVFEFMDGIPENTNQGTPLQWDPCSFPCFGNIGPSFIATLNLLRITMGLLVWLFSTFIVLNSHNSTQVSMSYQQHQIKEKKNNKNKRSKDKRASHQPLQAMSKACHQLLQAMLGESHQPLQFMLSVNNQPFLSMLGILVLLRNLVKQDEILSSLVNFAREITLLTCSLNIQRYNESSPNSKDILLLKKSMVLQHPFHPATENHAGGEPSTSENKVGERKRKRNANSPTSYAWLNPLLTIYLVWMRLYNCWAMMLSPSSNLILLPKSLFLNNLWLMKWLI